ncbi:hypothetical protein RRG08_004462 [Elysia crispata]|uniref:Uncharacterized protein n=1 Tax=Elysia crispata TaxID=231223 RepID=A0AAE1AWQ0_9GAST|nr:hypothetical protein RRG08_004462 [Elysia crispata]
MSWELQWVFVLDARTSPSFRLANHYALDVLRAIREQYDTDKAMWRHLSDAKEHRIMTRSLRGFDLYLQRCAHFRATATRLVSIMNADDHSVPDWTHSSGAGQGGEYRIDQSSPSDSAVTSHCRRLVRSTRVTRLDDETLRLFERNMDLMRHTFRQLMDTLERNRGARTTGWKLHEAQHN